ncbi:hypothetical protein BLNAU_15741 [Blattamonas nauphoetae]|uniref:B30.2/SPRY domain-containing protein n=1 Tax=Blattamonas nauphoetae TaxID=2049346 RepID=A0ABQ9XGG1_9EUKA|nr:hypothetical protein BLNAU_15741 [Blattamonas nauphoetae]
MGHSSSSLRKTKTKSNPAIAEQTQSRNAPAQQFTLPPLLFSSRSLFAIENTTITRSTKPPDRPRYTNNCPLLLKTPISQGILSVTITVLSLPRRRNHFGVVWFGLLDSIAAVPKFREALGYNVKDSVSLTSSIGDLYRNAPSTGHEEQFAACHSDLREGDCVRMEVDMESTPRTVQFFVNGQSGYSFVSGLPPSVRIGQNCYFAEDCAPSEMDPLELGLYSASEKTNRRFKMAKQQLRFLFYLFQLSVKSIRWILQ